MITTKSETPFLPNFQKAMSSLLLLALGVQADCYLQAPRGSNNKLSEQSNTVQNDKRLYDSQVNTV